MIAAIDIKVTKVERSKLLDTPLENVPFGRFFTDHMLEADFENGEWKNVEIKPYQPLLLSPSVAALHYGQAIFEEISEHFRVIQTGKNKSHFTVELPKPVTQEVADLFNSLFQWFNQ